LANPLGRARRHSRWCSLSRNEPGDAIKTLRRSFFDNETIFVFITTSSIANLPLKFKNQNKFHSAQPLQENLALSAANQSGRTIAAI